MFHMSRRKQDFCIKYGLLLLAVLSFWLAFFVELPGRAVFP